MTSKTLLPLLLLAPALAWSAPAPTVNPASTLFGSPARIDTVSRTLAIEPGARHVNVASGESVALQAGGQTVGWTFLQSIHGDTMNLGLLMPGVPGADKVYVHIAPSEIYSAG